MRHAAAVVVILAATAASAQYKTPQTPPTLPSTIQSGNPAVQITPTTADDRALETARRIERDEAIKMVKRKKAVWVDVRGADQYAQGHIPGAINIPLSELPNRWQDLPLKKFLITYCA